MFSAASVLCLNLKKCELFALKEYNTSHKCDIPIVEKVSDLGITIMRNEEDRYSKKLYFDYRKDKSKCLINGYIESHP